jgi:hypothetical protein
MAGPACNLCISGVNYTIACDCFPCGGNGLSMSTSNPNPAVCQSVAGKDGGASCVSSSLNAIGKWGTALTGILQGKAVATNKSGVAVGARGATLGNALSTNTILLILVIAGVVIFMVTRK